MPDNTLAIIRAAMYCRVSSDDQAIGFNPEDCLIYHPSGLDSKILETINPVGLAVTNVPLSGDAYTEALALLDNGSSFLLAAGGPELESFSTLCSLTDAGVASLIGDMNHNAKGLAFLRDEHDTVDRCRAAVGGVTSFERGSGSSAAIVLLAGGVTLIVAKVATSAWYSRKRWPGSRS